jgi:glycerate 2-kinase
MRILIAPDKFAGTLTAAEAVSAIAAGWTAERPDDEVRTIPMADGGSGSLGVVRAAQPGARTMTREVSDPLGRSTTASWLALPDRSAFVEAAEACGLHLLSVEERDPLHTTSRGVGELIGAAADDTEGPIIVGLGGSGTVDGGAGALQALGFELLDAHGNPIRGGGSALAELVSIRSEAANPMNPVVVAADVTSTLEECAALFGPQKGADADAVVELDGALRHFADIAERDLPGGPWRHLPGSGAAGGLGFALMAAYGARVEAGAAVVARLCSLPEAIEWSDVVVTGEGSLDEQSLAGKTPIFVATEARRRGCTVLAIAGRVGPGLDGPFDAVAELGDRGMSEPAAAVTAAACSLARGLTP